MNYIGPTRREFLQCAIPAALHLVGSSNTAIGSGKGAEHTSEELPTVRAITRGPKFHWFAYYDKLQFDPTCRYVLGMEVDSPHGGNGRQIYLINISGITRTI